VLKALKIGKLDSPASAFFRQKILAVSTVCSGPIDGF